MASQQSKKEVNNADVSVLEAARKQNEREAQLTQLLGVGDKRGLKLVGGSITKATFEEAIAENMELFGVSREQAVQDVAKEFKLLGVDTTGLN